MKPNPYIPPVLENTKDKAEPLDWGAVQFGNCFLNHLPTQGIPIDAPKRTWGLLKLTTLAAIFVWFALAWAPMQQFTGYEFLGFTMLLAAVAAGIYFVITPTEDLKQTPAWIMILALLVIPLVLWFFVLISPWLSRPTTAFLILFFGAVPLLVWLFDCIATHVIYWITAHPPLDLNTLNGWRLDWTQRFFIMPTRTPRRQLSAKEAALHERVMKARNAYGRGILWMVLVFGVLPYLVILFSPNSYPSQLGVRMGVVILGSLLVIGLFRNLDMPGGFMQFMKALPNFVFYTSVGRYPPWTFQSPCGGAEPRQFLFIGALFLFNVGLLTTVNFFQWIYFNDFTVEYLPVALVEALEGERTEILGAAFSAVGRGNFFVVSCFMIQVILCLLYPTTVFLLAGYAFLGPVLAAHDEALLGKDAYEPNREWNKFDCYVDRLIHSINPFENRSFFVGVHPELDYPILLHSDLLFEHAHILGGTGTGKTALGLTTHVIQMIRRQDSAVVIIDAKGDPALFHTARIEAEKANRKFRWFTNKPNHSTYAFNPFDQEVLRAVSLEESAGLLLNSLNLHHGDEYGRAWFSMVSRILTKVAIDQTLPENARPHSGRQRTSIANQREAGPPRSFRDLHQLIVSVMEEFKDMEAGKHVAYMIEKLADMEQLNLTPAQGEIHPAMEHAIAMPRVLRENEVVYFYLEGAMDTSTVAEIGRLAIYSLLAACMHHKQRTGAAPRAYCICDEAQLIIAKNIENVLAQARSHGLSFILSHQSMSQLNPPGGTDLRELVMSCTCIKQIFSARDPWMQKYLAEVSGRARYASISYNQYAAEVAKGFLGLAYVQESFGGGGVAVSEAVGPRLTAQDIQDINRNDNLCILGVERMKGYTCLQGYSPIHVDWLMSDRAYSDRQKTLSWPPKTDDTLLITSPWPEPNPETMVAKPERSNADIAEEIGGFETE